MSNWLIKLATLAIVLAAAVAIAQGPRVELQAVLPDSLEGFTEAVQDTATQPLTVVKTVGKRPEATGCRHAISLYACREAQLCSERRPFVLNLLVEYECTPVGIWSCNDALSALVGNAVFRHP